MEHAFLLQASLYFAAAVVAVMVAHRLGLGSVAGYLLAGIAIGPWGLQLVAESQAIGAFAELGVVMLLFVIGLELEPQRLWSMRAKPLGTHGGEATFAVLLFQDLAVIPMLAALPLLSTQGGWSGFSWQGVGFALAAVIGTLVLGHYIARPIFRHIARTRLREIFTAFALLLVLGIAQLFESAGLSMALGAFLAGVLLAESEYRHEIEAAIEPFKGLLLGLFFIAVGMSVDFAVLREHLALVAGLIVGVFVLKGAVLWLIARV